MTIKSVEFIFSIDNSDSKEPLRQILEANRKFAIKYSHIARRLIINPSDAEALKSNPTVIFLGDGSLINNDGKFVVIPFLTLVESPDLIPGSARLE